MRKEAEDRVATIRYGEIFEAMKSLDTPFAKMICDYLEDIGVDKYRKLQLSGTDGNSLKFLLIQLLGMPHQTGMGKQQSNASTLGSTRVLDDLLKNVQFLGERMREANEGLIKNRVNRRFYIDPFFDHKFLKRRLLIKEKEDKKGGGLGDVVDVLPDGGIRRSGYVRGGYLIVSSIAAISAAGIYPEIGFQFELEKGNLRYWAYAQFWGKNLGSNTYRETDYLDLAKFPSRAEAEKIFGSLLKRSLNAARKKRRRQASQVVE